MKTKSTVSPLSIVSLIISVTSLVFWCLLYETGGTLKTLSIIGWVFISPVSLFVPIVAKYHRKTHGTKGRILEIISLVISVFTCDTVLVYMFKLKYCIDLLIVAGACVLYAKSSNQVTSESIVSGEDVCVDQTQVSSDGPTTVFAVDEHKHKRTNHNTAVHESFKETTPSLKLVVPSAELSVDSKPRIPFFAHSYLLYILVAVIITISVGSCMYISSIKADVQDAYDRGYYMGEKAGYNEGYKKGADGGYNVAFSDGYEEGYDSGYEFGYDNGYVSALADDKRDQNTTLEEIINKYS